MLLLIMLAADHAASGCTEECGSVHMERVAVLSLVARDMLWINNVADDNTGVLLSSIWHSQMCQRSRCWDVSKCTGADYEGVVPTSISLIQMC